MICPKCQQYVFVSKPSECPTCHAKVAICRPCFGTGLVDVIDTGTARHGRHMLVECQDCAGRGLVAL